MRDRAGARFAPTWSGTMPLLRNGYALGLNACVTSGLGVVFWLVATQRFSPAAVGVGSSMVAAATLLGAVAQLGLVNALNRFVPRAGRQTARLVATSYAVGAMLAVVLGLAALGVINRWLPEIAVVARDPAMAAWFVAAVVLWCLFVLQDAALTGLRRAGWVLVENVVFALCKIAILFVPLVSGMGHALFLAWTLPLVPIVVLVNLAVFRVFIPAHQRAEIPPGPPIGPGDIGRFVAVDYALALVSTALIGAMPLLVLHGAGAEAAASFSLAWSIAYSLYLLSRAMTTSLLVEAAADPARIGEYSFRIAKHVGFVLAPPVVLVLVFAPHILHVFGPSYAEEGATLLRLLAVASLPGALIAVYTAVERARGHVVELLKVTVIINATVIGLSYVLLRRFGLDGLGVAWLAVQSAAAFVLLVTRLGRPWIGELTPATLARLAAPLRIVRDCARRRQQVATVVPMLQGLGRAVELPELRLVRVLPSVGDVTIAVLDAGEDRPPAVLKVASTPSGAAALDREVEVLSQLASDRRLAGWEPIVPTVLLAGRDHDHERAFVVQHLVAGRDGRAVLGDPTTGPLGVAAALATAAELHRRTAHRVLVGDDLVARWVDEPLAVLEPHVRHLSPAAVGELGAELRGALTARSVVAARVHGDLSPGNLLFSPDGRHVTGIVDWERSMSSGLPDVDIVHLLLSTRMLLTGSELGDVVVSVLTASVPIPVDSPLADRTIVLLAWLHHVSGILAKTDRYANHPVWIPRNLESVLSRRPSTVLAR